MSCLYYVDSFYLTRMNYSLLFWLVSVILILYYWKSSNYDLIAGFHLTELFDSDVYSAISPLGFPLLQWYHLRQLDFDKCFAAPLQDLLSFVMDFNLNFIYSSIRFQLLRRFTSWTPPKIPSKYSRKFQEPVLRARNWCSWMFDLGVILLWENRNRKIRLQF